MNSVVLKDYCHIRQEYITAEAITPGSLVELTSAGYVQNHSTEAGNAAKMFMLEDGTVGTGLDTDIASGARGTVWKPIPGDEVLAILADNQVVVVGDFLSSNGDGTLKKHVPDSSDYYAATDVTVKPLQIVAQAIEAVTTSGATDTIKVAIV